MKISAAVLDRMQMSSPYAQSRPVSVETVELGEPGVGEVLVRITAAGLCHSNPSIVNGDRPQQMPMALDEINAGFDRLAAGEAVQQVIVFWPSAAAYG